MKKNLLLIIGSSLLISCMSQATAVSTNTPISITETPTQTFTPKRTTILTVLPTATPVPHPMSIVSLRNQNYPGSAVTIVKELERGFNYRRYYAYYLSEGLKIYALLTIPNGTPPG